MPRKPSNFSKTDYMRAVESAKSCGLQVTRTEIAKDGRIILHHGDTTVSVPDAMSDFDHWKAGQDARSS